VNTLLSRARLWTAAWLLLVLAGCAVPPKAPPPPGVQAWTGRLALAVDGQENRSFSAGFDLRGSPDTGELTLYTPLGGTLAVLFWAPGSATLRAEGGERQFPSVEALAQEVTGAPIPLAALFDWLQGKATPVHGWEPDVSQVAEGRLRARRATPPPPADLRVLFER
jgi:outer membrane lipoprotein LolB